jgi:outer membrane lipoprotein-sorting protein
MYKSVFLLLLILNVHSAGAQYPGYTLLTNSSAFREQFSAASQKMTSLSCNFVQEKNLSMLSEKISSKGRFWYKKDNRIRMEYQDPFEYLMILNNDKVYIKDGQKENTISTRSNQLFRQINSVMIDCVKGTALSSTDFSIRLFESAQFYLVELTPVAKSLKAFFKNINIIVDKKDYSASEIEMFELSGDNTLIHFLNKQLNTPIADELFTVH